MGLPIWRNPEETKPTVKDALKIDPTAAARSSIRRRPSIHGGRSARPRLTRDGTVRLPRPARSPPPHAGYSYVRDTPRSSIRNGVPPISTLLESADRHRTSLPPPPPVPESRNYYEQLEAAASGRSDVTSSMVASRDTTARSERQAEYMRERLQQRMQRSREPDGPLNTGARGLQAVRDVGLPLPELGSRTRGERFVVDGPLDRTTMPTPPQTGSDVEDDSLFVPLTRSPRRSHPLRNSWSPDSPPAVDGLGDRNRSPTPPDGWEIMRSTITPDASLPSAESSFTSAAASRSFTSAADTTITEPEVASSSTTHSRRNSSGVDDESDSVSSVDPDDICDDEQMTGAEAMAEFMYNYEVNNADGRERVAHHSDQRSREGNRFALAHESATIDIGFRLIEEALETEEGRARLVQVGVLAQCEDSDDESSAARAQRELRSRTDRALQRAVDGTSAELNRAPTPQPDRYGEAALAATREARRSTREYFRSYANGFMGGRRPSPPPDYEALTSHPDVEIFTSRDEPVPQPVSPPTQRSQTEVVDAILSGDETDLAAMRRVVERLARRDDVPEEWWSSIGLNLSRSRPRSRSPARAERNTEAAGQRVRDGRVERRNSRL